MLDDINKAIREDDVEMFNTKLAELEELLQDADSLVEGLAGSGALCYAASVGSLLMIGTLIDKGVGKTLLKTE